MNRNKVGSAFLSFTPNPEKEITTIIYPSNVYLGSQINQFLKMSQIYEIRSQIHDICAKGSVITEQMFQV